MFARFTRSWDLAVACLGLLKEDKSLLVFPLMSAVALVLIVGSFAVPMIPLVEAIDRHGFGNSTDWLTYACLFLFYWIQFTVLTFFNTALVQVAMRRFEGQTAAVGDGLRRAVSRLPVILAYSAIAATVGTILRVLEERVGIIGKIVIGLVGFVWAVATALVVPVLAAENVGPFDAIRRSVELIKKSWGESLIGAAGIGLVIGLIMVVIGISGVVFFVAALAAHANVLAVILLVGLVLTLCLLALTQATLNGIYSAALYRYAAGETHIAGIDTALLQGAFRPRS